MFRKKAEFSPDVKYFACFNSDDRLSVWDISSNNIFMDCKFAPKVYGKCTSLRWIPLHREYHSPKKVKKSFSSNENQLLALGTAKGDVLLYNIATRNLNSHFVARHSDSVNDIDFHSDTNSFFTCSDDKCIGVWDLLSGRQILKWTADVNPIFSICVLDENNILSSNTSILWWNVSEKCVIKKFEGHSTKIFKLLPVNAFSLNTCYFLSVALNDVRIKAWSLNSNNTQMPVVSFFPSSEPEDMDVSRSSSKDKPLILSVVTENGFCHFYEHPLNGNLDLPLHPKATIEVIPEQKNSDLNSKCVLSIKLSDDSECCTVAFRDQEKIAFKKINIKELFQKNKNISNSSLQDRLSEEKDCKISKKISINGVKSPKSSANSPRKKEVPHVKNSSMNSPCNRIYQPSLDMSNTPEERVAENSKKKQENRNCIKSLDISTSDSSVSMFIKGLQTQNSDLIDAILQSNDIESISNSVKCIPVDTLKIILEELARRLHHNQRYSFVIGKWLKEILRIHLNYLIESTDTAETLDRIKELIQAKKTSETISKMTALKGLLSLHQLQNIADGDDSESEEIMEL